MLSSYRASIDLEFPGGKVKPLKAAKKEKKELDDDDLAFKERQKAGMDVEFHRLHFACPY